MFVLTTYFVLIVLTRHELGWLRQKLLRLTDMSRKHAETRVVKIRQNSKIY